MQLLTDIGSLYTCAPGFGSGVAGRIDDAAIVWDGERITWIGKEVDLPGHLDAAVGLTENVGSESGPAPQPRLSAHGKTVIPGLVDCHTHLGFGGWRADEFARRLAGESYLDIARSGGGIKRTMRQTREASESQLVAHCEKNLEEMLQLGVTTVECKSGYGLSTEAELKLLRVYRQAAKRSAQRLVSTFLGAHVVPPEWENDRAGYVDLICTEMLPLIAEEGLASFCDVFVEDTAFSADEARTIFEAATPFGMRPKLHVDQLKDGGGALLAADVGAISADHLEYTGSEGIAAMAGAGVTAVCLPLATLYLKQKPMTARAFVDAGVSVAVATDFNPGSAPSFDLPLAMMLSCTMNGLTPDEALVGATRHASRALGLEDQVGSLKPGMMADFVVLGAESVTDWMYHFRPNVCRRTFIGGRCMWATEPGLMRAV